MLWLKNSFPIHCSIACFLITLQILEMRSKTMRCCQTKRQRLYIEHLVGQKKFDLIIAKDIVCMLASGSTNSNNKVVAKVLSVDKHNVRRDMGRRL